jgi:hypothetical protein
LHLNLELCLISILFKTGLWPLALASGCGMKKACKECRKKSVPTFRNRSYDFKNIFIKKIGENSGVFVQTTFVTI